MRKPYILALPTLAICFLLPLPGKAEAKRLHKEAAYQSYWCAKAGGVTEIRLSDSTRVDCLTDTHAIEFDFGSKWAEAIGQALHYSVMTGKPAGIVLIMETQEDQKYLLILKNIIDKKNIVLEVWTITPEELIIEKPTLQGI